MYTLLIGPAETTAILAKSSPLAHLNVQETGSIVLDMDNISAEIRNV